MHFTNAERAAAVTAVQAALNVYSCKVDQTQARIHTIETELRALRSELAHDETLTSGKASYGALMMAIAWILGTAARPMTVRDITVALQRPARGQEGRGPRETVRRACKRLAAQGRVAEDPVGIFTAESQPGASP
ncbi:hypothetical protein [Streptomyces sp. NPDC059538]|uniref:hypothetical protein n=1 Tax=Streptomyces sp. NPDC059538 TaxID=3346860 RepID=UPI0036881BF7